MDPFSKSHVRFIGAFEAKKVKEFAAEADTILFVHYFQAA